MKKICLFFLILFSLFCFKVNAMTGDTWVAFGSTSGDYTGSNTGSVSAQYYNGSSPSSSYNTYKPINNIGINLENFGTLYSGNSYTLNLRFTIKTVAIKSNITNFLTTKNYKNLSMSITPRYSNGSGTIVTGTNRQWRLNSVTSTNYNANDLLVTYSYTYAITFKPTTNIIRFVIKINPNNVDSLGVPNGTTQPVPYFQVLYVSYEINENQNNDDIINNQNQNTQDIIDSQNQNKDDIINNQNQNQQQTNDRLDELNKNQEETNDFLTDDTPPDVDISGLGNVSGLLPPGPLDSLLNIPFKFLSVMTSSLGDVCVPLSGEFIEGATLTLPCFGDVFYSEVSDSLMIFINLIPSCFILINYFKHLYKKVERATSMNSSTDDEWGVI